MDAHRFDTLSKSLATTLSRRSAVRRGGVGIAATLLAAVGLRGTAARQADAAWYTVIRRYSLTGSPDQVLQELNNGYLPLIRETAGYVAYSAVSSDSNVVTTITVFESQAQLEQATQTEESWVAENLASLLPAPAETTQGDAIIFDVNTDLIRGSGPAPTAAVVPTQPPPTEAPPTEPPPCTGTGCDCNGGVQNACDEGLVCCQTGDNPMPGGPGVCVADDACGDVGCTGIGCPCQGGVQNACDEGLVCCQSQMGGGSIPGGDGMCAAEDACGDDDGDDATPVD